MGGYFYDNSFQDHLTLANINVIIAMLSGCSYLIASNAILMSCCTQNAAELLRINSNMISQPFLRAATPIAVLFFLFYHKSTLVFKSHLIIFYF